MTLLSFIYSIFASLGIGFLSSLFTRQSLMTWYKTLEKPSYNPPNWVFAPVWTVLYICIGISFALASNSPTMQWWHIGLFLLQYVLNFLWSLIFFTYKSLRVASLEIVLLLIVIASLIVILIPINLFASLLLVPYALWVSFATILTFSILKKNI